MPKDPKQKRLDTPKRVDPAPPSKKTASQTKMAAGEDLAPKKNAQTAAVQGKIVRKDPAAPARTASSDQETIGPEMQVDTNKASEGPVPQKPSDSLDASVSSTAASKAATLLGDFKLLKKLGQGGMGAVYKAQMLSENRIVAVKVLSKELAGKPAYVKRFQREAKAMQKADHPNILGCLDVGEAKGYHFIAMEFVEGGSVEAWLKKLGRFSIGDALHIIMKTAEGLQHAHDKSLIHRDIKPDNILLTKDGVVKIADLGLAKDTDEDQSLTKTGAGAGTPIYMAPEQARDVKHVDSRVDIYALGVMLYVFLTGRAPFEGATLVELTTAKEKGKFDPMRRHNTEVPPKLDLIVDKMLAKDPRHRYETCEDIITQINALGLTNEQLTFLDSEGETTPAPNAKRPKAVDTDAPNPTPKLPTKTKGPANKIAAKTATPKVAAQKTNVQEEEEPQDDTWYWNLVTPEGRIITKKVTTEQLRTLIKAGHLQPDAEVSKGVKDKYRPAGSYIEFQSYFKARDAKTQINVKGRKVKSQMEELADDYERRKKYGWVKRLFGNVRSTIMGLLWILLILGVIGVGGYFGYVYFIAAP